METGEWKIITCPHCANLVKVAGHLMSSRLACPTCKEPISRSSAFPHTVPPGPKPAIPTTRAFDPSPVRLRGSDREAWEARAPDSREIDFKERLAKTTDHDGSQELVTPVRRRRHFTKNEDGIDWEGGQRVRKRRGGRRRMIRRFFARFGWLLSLIILGLAGIIYRFQDIGSGGAGSNYVQTPAPIPVPQEEKAKVLELRPSIEILQEIRPLLQKFLHAKSAAELRPLIRDPERVIPLMDAYYAEQHPFAPADIRAMPDQGNLFVYKHFVVVSLETKGFHNFYVTLEKGPEGYLVDWESYIGYGEMSLSTFRMQKPTSPVLMRFDLKPVHYYNLDFEGREDAYQSYQLNPVDDSPSLYGYVRRHSPEHDKITAALLQVGNSPCVLKIRYPENSTQGDQVEISEFVQKGYVIRGDDLPPSNQSGPSGQAGTTLKSESPPSANPVDR